MAKIIHLEVYNMAKEKVIVGLSNGKDVKTTKDGWDKEACADTPVLLAGWQEKKASHHPISLGVALVCTAVIVLLNVKRNRRTANA